LLEVLLELLKMGAMASRADQTSSGGVDLYVYIYLFRGCKEEALPSRSEVQPE
jgi:hypothetical protein